MGRLHVQPDEATAEDLAARWPLVPVWAEVTADVATPVGLFGALAGPGPGVLLESVERSERWGRYSFVAGDPAALLTIDADGPALERFREGPALALDDTPADAPAALRSIAAQVRAPRIPGLPTMAGGLVGLLAYEAATLLDGSPHPGAGATTGAPVAFLLCDRGAVFDHWRQRLFLIAHVGAGRYREGVAALEALAERAAAAGPPPIEPLAPASPLAPPADVDDDAFRAGIRRAKEHIAAGDIFQTVLSRRVSLPVPDGGLSVYRRLRLVNPSPYMFFIRLPGLELAGSSPEPLVRVEGRHVLTRPIAGTRPRGADPEEDLRLERELRDDPKERAEHAMLVDLARNDLGKVCRAGSVTVTQHMEVERWSRVMHLVSTVEGDLRDDAAPLDALAATFPAGTVTGAPKRRAMEIIAEEEAVPRGPYAGAAGYVSFEGDLDFCITIRTAVIQDGRAIVQAGAGIVADSDPDLELREVAAKASALVRAAGGGGG